MITSCNTIVYRRDQSPGYHHLKPGRNPEKHYSSNKRLNRPHTQHETHEKHTPSQTSIDHPRQHLRLACSRKTYSSSVLIHQFHPQKQIAREKTSIKNRNYPDQLQLTILFRYIYHYFIIICSNYSIFSLQSILATATIMSRDQNAIVFSYLSDTETRRSLK